MTPETRNPHPEPQTLDYTPNKVPASMERIFDFSCPLPLFSKDGTKFHELRVFAHGIVPSQARLTRPEVEGYFRQMENLSPEACRLTALTLLALDGNCLTLLPQVLNERVRD